MQAGSRRTYGTSAPGVSQSVLPPRNQAPSTSDASQASHCHPLYVSHDVSPDGNLSVIMHHAPWIVWVPGLWSLFESSMYSATKTESTRETVGLWSSCVDFILFFLKILFIYF